METSKRLNNTIGLKFAFIGWTDTKPARYKVTQTNTNKSILISADFGSLTPFEGMIEKLNSIEEIQDFSLIIDNTQSKYYLFCINTKTNEIPNLLLNFKKF